MCDTTTVCHVDKHGCDSTLEEELVETRREEFESEDNEDVTETKNKH